MSEQSSPPVRRALAATIRTYQRAAEDRPSPCRFVPSCSTYALEAIEIHGAGRGSWLALRRVARCHPWGGQGHDPVPAPRDPISDRATADTPTDTKAS